MTYSISLIDKAAEKCGSFYKLSKRVDLAQSTISEIRAGRRRLPADVVPLLAEVIGMDVDEAIHGVLMEHAKGTKREAVLREILGKALAAGGAAMSLSSYKSESNDSTEKINNSATVVNPLYIVSSRATAIGRRHLSMAKAAIAARMSTAMRPFLRHARRLASA